MLAWNYPALAIQDSCCCEACQKLHNELVLLCYAKRFHNNSLLLALSADWVWSHILLARMSNSNSFF